MQKIRMDHQAKFRDKNKCFVHVLFPILPCIFTSSILRTRLSIQIWFHSADVCILAMSCVGYGRKWLKPFCASLNNHEREQITSQKKKTTRTDVILKLVTLCDFLSSTNEFLTLHM